MLAAPLDETSTDRDRANEVLTPFVPRLVIDWLRESPNDLYREVEGSMAFVDISGFTALSERLARKGKIGAELMRDTLNGVFEAAVEAVEEAIVNALCMADDMTGQGGNFVPALPLERVAEIMAKYRPVTP